MTSNRILVGFLAILLLISGLSSRPPQQTGDIFFEEENVWVRGEFAAFYHAAPDAQRLFGNAISEAMDDPQRPGIQVQYFERARMDLDPTKPAGQRVSLANLGETLRDETIERETINFSTNTNLCRAFTNERLVCYAFLYFYDTHNGAVYIGQPVSNTETEDGLLVQYFEHARMEWRADRPVGQRVVLTELGRLDYIVRIGNNNPNIVNRSLGRITAHAFVEKPVLAEGEEQQVFFVVFDQRGNPVPDASVIFSVEYLDPKTGKAARTDAYRVENLTNADGYTRASFRVNGVAPNDVINIIATARLDGGLETVARTWFRIWY